MRQVKLYTRSAGKEWHEAKLLAQVSSRGSKIRQTRWSELYLYTTPHGRFLCQEVGKSLHAAETTRYRLVRAETPEEIIKAIGYGWLAKALYDAAGIDHAEHIDRARPPKRATCWHLQQENAPDLMFHGYKVASVSSACEQQPRRIRWTEIHLYQTVCGQIACEVLGRTLVEGERTRQQVYIASTPTELAGNLGYGRLANKLYLDMGWSIGRSRLLPWETLEGSVAHAG